MIARTTRAPILAVALALAAIAARLDVAAGELTSTC